VTGPPAALRERIGLVLQDIAVEPYLTVRETLARNVGYYPAPRDVDEVIGLVGLVGLDGQRRQKVRALSGGQKRRLDLGLGLIGRPDVLFLDEPTTLADRVAVISGGEIVAEGTPATIGGRDTARTRIRFALPAGYTVADLALAVRPGDGLDPPLAARPGDNLVTVETAEPTETLYQLTGWALRNAAVLDRLTVERPSLEDVYLRLTSDPGAPDHAMEVHRERHQPPVPA
jgi:ABC-2 type transport system ATP-binding protein